MFIQFETERAAMYASVHSLSSSLSHVVFVVVLRLCVKGLRGRIFADRAVGARFVDPEEVPSA
jgi:hypothetical protein